MRSRPFLTRLLFAAFGMLLLCVFGFVGLAWGLRTYPDLCIKFLGEERSIDLVAMYLSTLATVLPADRDDDGFPDSVELYTYRNPDDGNSYPDTEFIYKERGATVIDLDGAQYPPDLLLNPGERRHLRLQVGFAGRPIVFPPGWHLLATSGAVSWVYHPGGTRESHRIVVPVSTDGTMELDYAAHEFRDGGTDDQTVLVVLTPVSGSRLGDLNVHVAWREKPLPCTMEPVPDGDPIRVWLDDKLKGREKDPLVRLTWQPEGRAADFYIEATRSESSDAPAEDWFIVGLHPAEARSCLISFKLDDKSRSGHRGPLRFRVIPTKWFSREE